MISGKLRFLNNSGSRNIIVILIFLLSVLYREPLQAQVYIFDEVVPIHLDIIKRKVETVLEKNYDNGIISQAVMSRAQFYLPLIERIIKSYGIPDDFKYMPLVESRFQNIESPAGAGGFWQLMPETARELGLVVNATIDERNNIIKSTHAAARYLLYLYDQTHSWTLTAACYNYGIGNIAHIILGQGTHNYFKMRLNKETAEYIYNILACKLIYGYSIKSGAALDAYLNKSTIILENR